MAEWSSVDNASEEVPVFDFVCGPCNVDGEILQAKGYCSDCQDYLCDLCFKTHIRPKPMRHHVLLDEKKMPKDKKATTAKKTSDFCTERCEKHPGNIIVYYCQRHDFLMCTKCLISDNHRKCEGVVCVEDTVDGIFNSLEFTNFEGMVEQLTNVLSESSSMQQQNDEKIKIYSIRAKKDIKNFRANMNEYLDRLENEMDNQVSQMKDRQTSQLMSTSKQIENLEKEMKAIKETIERTRNLGQKSNLYIYMKRNSNQLKLLKDRIETVKKDGEVSVYTFTPDDNLLGQKAETFGTLVVKENTKHVEDCLDTLTVAKQSTLTVIEYAKEKTSTTKIYTKDDFSVVNRFEITCKKNTVFWGYSKKNAVEAIRFMCDTDILLGGFGLFGGRGEYFGRIKLFELGPDENENKGDDELLAESERVAFRCASGEKYPLLLKEPMLLQANSWYVAWASISGPYSDCGSGGQALVTTTDQVTFKFRDSKKSNNGTTVNDGQIPQLLYRLP